MKPTKPPLPLAKKIVHHSHHHGNTIADPYHWLRDSQWPKVEDAEVIAYLNAENDYYQAVMHPLAKREEAIYEELVGKIKLTDESVPVKKDNYYYYTRTNEDSNYPIFCRKFESLTNPEEIILDINVLAEGNEFFSYNAISISPDHQKIAYSTDTTGAERNIIQIKDLTNNELLNDRVFEVIDHIIWHENGEGFFYCKLNQYWRPDQVFYHQLNTPTENDLLIYKEENSKNRLQLYKSASKRFIFIASYTKENSEIVFIDCNTTSLSPQLFAKRSEKHIYFPDHINNEFFILTNDIGRNFRLVKTSINNPSQEYWQDLIPYSAESYLQSVIFYKNHFATESREHGLEKIRIYSYNNIDNPETIQFQLPTYSANIEQTTIDAEGVRINYSSLNVPETTLEYNFESKDLHTLKVKEIPSGYDASLYQSERIFAVADDGVKIPISLVYKKSLFTNQTNVKVITTTIIN